MSNIDWPSTNGLSTGQQKTELLKILNLASELKLNAVLLQVRPACDALYPSNIEPWSEYLSGTMGKPPQPFYDPLAFAVEEAHKRGIELHAWFNPFRARHGAAKSPVAANHISKTRPQLVKKYGQSLWLDPGLKEVQDYSLLVIVDVLKRYDVDAIHFDDYFYPYKEKDASGIELDFPDDASWKRYGGGTGLSRDDWRRNNVNTFIQRTYQSIKAVKPWVKFGVSPFGIWRPANPQSVRGYDAYAKIYADSRLWLANGWLDYFAPQIYWSIEAPNQSFPVLLKWWMEQNSKGRHVWPGLNTANVGHGWSPEEIAAQIRLTRKEPNVNGQIHWGMRRLISSPEMINVLQRNLYRQSALVPASPWLSKVAPATPKLAATARGRGSKATWSAGSKTRPCNWVIQSCSGKRWDTEVVPGNRLSKSWPTIKPEFISISAVDRFGNISKPAGMKLTPPP